MSIILPLFYHTGAYFEATKIGSWLAVEGKVQRRGLKDASIIAEDLSSLNMGDTFCNVANGSL